MQKITVKEYARLNGVSVYEVIKRIRRGELQGVTEEENGIRVNYVVLDKTDTSMKTAKSAVPATPSTQERSDLAVEVARLREEVAELRALMERCCMRTQLKNPHDR